MERMTIIVQYNPKPGPGHDYDAWVDGGEERYGMGTGETPADALLALGQLIILKDE